MGFAADATASQRLRLQAGQRILDFENDFCRIETMTPIALIAHYASGDRRYPLDGDEWIVGTHESSQVLLSDPTVSRRHARLARTTDGCSVEDLGSSNGTQINGKRIESTQSLRIGESLQFGSLVCTLIESEADEVELAIPAQSWQGREEATAEGKTGPTVSSDRLTRFFTETLPALILKLGSDTDHGATRVVGALAETFGGVWTLSRNSALLSSSGREQRSEGSRQTFESGPTQLAWTTRKPLDGRTFERIAAPVLALIEQRENTRPMLASQPEPDDAPSLPEPITRHDKLLNFYLQARRVAGAGLNVLIEGPSGTGKELFARHLHSCGRDDQPLVTLNCASLPQDLLDSELFGIERGVATGVDARAGKFELAHDGVIFLDEIGDMHSATQAKLLRVLQEREVYRVGGSKPRPARVQVVSATNRNLETLVEQGEFRLDLYHRIADWKVRLPSLEERAVDIANLAAHFLRQSCDGLGQGFGGISRAALECLHGYHWPGNVRELEREMKRCALFLETGEALRSDHLDERIQVARDTAAGTDGLKGLLARTEKRAIEQALQLCRGDVAAASERLGVGKSTLYRQIRNLGIEIG